ncbi:restriction endonuclease subunit S [Providencia rettgeri]|nr:restriction endonuclease subunit S [Providencia rettgeri]ELR5188194.1 restriction endonuclease subunit S [Providencia rettgeri]
MVGHYKEYFEYQPSNDVHIKQLPIGWIMKPLGLVAAKGRTSFVDGPFGSDLKSDEYQDEGIPLIQLNNIVIGKHILQNMKYITEKKMHQLSRHIAKPNDIVIAKMADPVARATLVNGQYDKYVIVADCVKLTIDASIADLSYVIYAINSKEVNSSAELVSTGTTRIRINLTELKNLKIPFPPLVIQQKIAHFLDHETAKIDTLINKQEKLIELLKEKRQAVISHAVTKGLNPDVSMKDSGVEWLGKVPEHWVLGRLKNVLKIRNGKDYKQVEIESGGYPVYGSGGIFKRSSEYLYDGESVLFGRKGTINKPLVVKGKFWTVDTMFYSELNKCIDANYVYLQATLFPFDLLSTNTALPSMTQEDLLNLGFVIPPYEEQLVISESISNHDIKFVNIIDKASKQIELMKERKTALISAAVTGKIDVRDWQPKGIQ